MLLPVEPHSNVLSTVGPGIRAHPIFKIILVLSIIRSTIAPCVSALPMHQILLPIAFIFSIVRPLISAKSINHVVFPFAFVFVALGPLIATNSIFLSFFVIADKCAAIRPGCLALPVLSIVDPHACVDCPVQARVSSVSIRFIIDKITFKFVAVCMPETPLTVRSVVLPVTLVFSSVDPYLDAVAVTHAQHVFSLWGATNRPDLASVDGPILVHKFVHIDEAIFFA